jgi:hypothetical protein
MEKSIEEVKASEFFRSLSEKERETLLKCLQELHDAIGRRTHPPVKIPLRHGFGMFGGR